MSQPQCAARSQFDGSAFNRPSTNTTPFPNYLLNEVMPTLKDTEWRLLCVIVCDRAPNARLARREVGRSEKP